MADFHCERVFRLPDERIVFAGRVLSGTVEAGMQVLVQCNPSFAIASEIVAVERVLTDQPTPSVGLVVECEDADEATMLLGLGVEDETLTVERRAEP